MKPRRFVALLATGALLSAAGMIQVAFSGASLTSASPRHGSQVAGAIDWTAPMFGPAVVSRTQGGSPVGAAGYVRSGDTYRVYANVDDAISGVASVVADASALTASQSSVTLTAGSYTAGGQSYGYASPELTADGSLADGVQNLTLRATDNVANSDSTMLTVSVDSTGPATSL